ncbi:MAG TPA: GAF domain-containing protein [Dehalococcoidia bacterium]|nr:GAF domain-containing protein [Dehalococcoidia bacterium]
MANSDEILKQVAQLATDLGPALTPTAHDELLRSIAEAARRIFDANACSLALLDEEQENVVFHVAAGYGEEQVRGLKVPVNQGIAGWVVTSGQPIAISDVSKDPRFARHVAESTGYVPKAIIAMPLETERGMIGVIEVLDRGPSSFAAGDDMEILGLFANQAALAIENSRVFTRLGQTLFEAAGKSTKDKDLQRSLLRIAEEPSEPNAELAELAACFNELAAEGPAERRGATQLIVQFLTYVRSRRRRG